MSFDAVNDDGPSRREYHHLARSECLAADLDRARCNERRALRVLGRQFRLGTRLQAPMHVEHRGMRDTFARAPNASPGDEPRPQAAAFVGRQVVTGVMRERRLGLLVFDRQRDPRLDAVHRAAFGARPLEALGMRDAAARRHPVHLAGAYRLFGADAVAMHDLSFEQVADGRQADVRMRPHIDGTRNPRLETTGPKWSKKMKGPTIRRLVNGSTRPTSKPPRSRLRWSITSSIINVSRLGRNIPPRSLRSLPPRGLVSRSGRPFPTDMQIMTQIAQG